MFLKSHSQRRFLLHFYNYELQIREKTLKKSKQSLLVTYCLINISDIITNNKKSHF